jgi:hypothetical protein
VLTLVEEVLIVLGKGWWEGVRVLESPEISFKILDMQLVFKERGALKEVSEKPEGSSFCTGHILLAAPSITKGRRAPCIQARTMILFFPSFTH